MTSFFEHQRISYKRSYVRNLIALASSDGTLGSEERELIMRIGQKRGLKPWQIEDIMTDPTAYALFLPESVSNRMNMLFDLMQVIYADNTVDAREMEFLSNLIEAFQLSPEVSGQLIKLFENGSPGADEWTEFVDGTGTAVSQTCHA